MPWFSKQLQNAIYVPATYWEYKRIKDFLTLEYQVVSGRGNPILFRRNGNNYTVTNTGIDSKPCRVAAVFSCLPPIPRALLWCAVIFAGGMDESMIEVGSARQGAELSRAVRGN